MPGEQHLWNYCVRQACLEVESWFNGQPFRWVDFHEREQPPAHIPDRDVPRLKLVLKK